jgi:hypothetical protein
MESITFLANVDTRKLYISSPDGVESPPGDSPNAALLRHCWKSGKLPMCPQTGPTAGWHKSGPYFTALSSAYRYGQNVVPYNLYGSESEFLSWLLHGSLYNHMWINNITMEFYHRFVVLEGIVIMVFIRGAVVPYCSNNGLFMEDILEGIHLTEDL